jgi:hypothetical protein
MSLHWPSSLGTFSRKIRKSLARRGMAATAKRFVTKPVEFARTCFREITPAYRRCRAAEADFDRRIGVETCVRTDPGWMARIHSDNWIHGIGYAPVPIQTASLLTDLNITYEDYVFIDFGAGKGRMLFLSSEFPFRSVIGVEYSPDLFATLERNLDNYRNPAQRCVDLQGILQDAVQFQLPIQPLVLFFHHPFDETVFRQVIANIEESLDQSPRDIRIIYYDPICGYLFDNNKYFMRLQEGKADRNIRYSSNWAIYGSVASSA